MEILYGMFQKPVLANIDSIRLIFRIVHNILLEFSIQIFNVRISFIRFTINVVVLIIIIITIIIIRFGRMTVVSQCEHSRFVISSENYNNSNNNVYVN
jgi:hypothetical protein